MTTPPDTDPLDNPPDCPACDAGSHYMAVDNLGWYCNAESCPGARACVGPIWPTTPPNNTPPETSMDEIVEAAPNDNHKSRTTQLRQEVESAVNRCCGESGSDTPDFILATYLMNCLEAFDFAVRAREKWYGRPAPDHD